MGVEGWVAIIGAITTGIVAIIMAWQGKRETKTLKRSMRSRGILPPGVE